MKKILTIILLISISFSVKLYSQITVTVAPSGGDYTSISAAYNANKTKSTPVLKIIVKQGTYNEQFIIDSIGFSGHPDSLAIISDPANTQAVNIKLSNAPGANNNYIIKLKNCKNFSLNGLTLTNNLSSYSHCLVLEDSCSNFTISNSNLTSVSTTSKDTSAAVILFNNANILNAEISNCKLSYGSNAILTTSSTFKTTKIINNQIQAFAYAGINLMKSDSVLIAHNNISTDTKSDTLYGILADSTILLKSNANFIRLNSSTAKTNTGIKILNSLSPLISNNMISITSDNTCIGTNLYKIQNLTYAFNNIFLEKGNSSSIGLRIDSTENTDIANNIIDMNDNIGYVFHFDKAYYSDFNLLYFPNSKYFGYLENQNITTFDIWKQNTSSEYQTIIGDPKYISNLDLHVTATNLISSKGDYFDAIPFDYDSQRRKNPPDIGADEVKSALFGNIQKDTTWSGIVYLDSVNIKAGVKLTITPGTEIITQNNSIIYGAGTIIANGTKDQPIIFAPAGQQEIYWKGIYAGTNSSFKYCFFRNAWNSAIKLYNANYSNIENCIFQDNHANNGAAIDIYNSENTNINACNFSSNNADNEGAIYTNQAISLTNCVFYNNNANIAADIALYNDTSTIYNNTFVNFSSNSKAKSIIASNSHAKIANNIFSGSSNGDTVIYCLNNSNLTLTKNLSYKNPNPFYKENGSILNIDTVFDLDPKFENANIADFHLTPSSGAMEIADQTLAPKTDFDGRTRPFQGTLPDLGAYEYQGVPMHAYAGKDSTFCDNKFRFLADNPSPYQGTWSSLNPTLVFDDVHNPNTYVRKLINGQNKIFWTVSDGINTITDTIILTSLKPNAFAGSDQSLIALYPSLKDTTTLYALDPTPYSGVWTSPDNTITFDFPSSSITKVRNLKHGDNVLIWTVNNKGCKNSDTVVVSSGYAITPLNSGSSFSWDNPNAWNIQQVPQKGDSVAIIESNVLINSFNANCNSLLVSSGGTLKLDGTTKGIGTLDANKIYVEQNPQKAKAADSATIILNNGTININGTANSLKPGITIGSKGQLIVDPINGGTAIVNIGKNRQLKIQSSSIFKNAQGDAQVVIRDGGKIYVQQTPQKNTKFIDKNIYVSTGGRIYIEQTPQKSAGASELVVGAGNKIYVEQTPQKNGQKSFQGGQIVINGGRIYVEQTPQKKSNIKGSVSDIYVLDGGKIYVEQTPQKKSIDSSVIDAPRINITGGQIIVGSNTNPSEFKGVQAKIRSNRIYVEQTPQKTLGNGTDTSLIVNSNAAIFISSAKNLSGQIYMVGGSLAQINSGGILSFADSSKFIMEQDASLIDLADNTIPANSQLRFLKIPGSILFSSPYSNLNSSQLTTANYVYKWNEAYNNFTELTQNQTITPFSGLKISPSTQNLSLSLNGTFNSGLLSFNLKKDKDGINLLGNPYPSAIDLNKISIPSGVQPVFYIYDYTNNNYSVIQKDGLNLSETPTILLPYQTFFLVTSVPTTINIGPKSQFHYPTMKKETYTNSANNAIILNIVGQDFGGDSWGIKFKNKASDNYEYSEDALKLKPLSDFNRVELYSMSNDGKKLCIDTRPTPNQNLTKIPLYFFSNTEQWFDIKLNYFSIDPNVKVFLVNEQSSDTTAINAQSTTITGFYNNSTTETLKFQLLIYGSMTNIKNLPKSNNISIYSFDNKIVISSNSKIINKIEIFNITGEKVFQKNINSKNTIINTGLQNGIYIIKAFSNDNVFNKKIILQ